MPIRRVEDSHLEWHLVTRRQNPRSPDNFLGALRSQSLGRIITRLLTAHGPRWPGNADHHWLSEAGFVDHLVGRALLFYIVFELPSQKAEDGLLHLVPTRATDYPYSRVLTP